MISAKIKLEIMRHAQDVYPAECCGVVTQKSRVQRYHRIKNVHDDPENAWSDGAQSLKPKRYAKLVKKGKAIAKVVGREL